MGGKEAMGLRKIYTHGHEERSGSSQVPLLLFLLFNVGLILLPLPQLLCSVVVFLEGFICFLLVIHVVYPIL